MWARWSPVTISARPKSVGQASPGVYVTCLTPPAGDRALELPTPTHERTPERTMEENMVANMEAPLARLSISRHASRPGLAPDF